MNWLRRIALSVGILTFLTLCFAGNYYYKGFYKPAHQRGSAPPAVVDAELKRINAKAALQKTWLRQHGFNSGLCFLIDMRLPSGKNRFFVYDTGRDSIILAGLVAHGCGNKNFAVTPVFSNENGSNNTALGRYRIGQPYRGRFGLAYKLYGLDASNDQAFNRNIVLHAYNAVPEGETQPYPICNSQGCPMVAPGFLEKLQSLIDKSGKPVLLWIFD